VDLDHGGLSFDPEFADKFEISRGSANMILTEDLGMRRLVAKFVPKLLSPEHQGPVTMEASNIPEAQESTTG
jgi:hypothetical protein